MYETNRHEDKIGDILARLFIALKTDMDATRQNRETYKSKDFFGIACPYLCEAYDAGFTAARDAMKEALTWKTGHPTEPGWYFLKYEDGRVGVYELERRVMHFGYSEPRHYLGFAREFGRNIKREEGLIAWAPIQTPEEPKA